MAPEGVRYGVSRFKKMLKNSTFAPPPGPSTTKQEERPPAEVQNLQAMAPEELSRWIEKEGRAMDSTSNPEDTQIKIKAQARTLTAAQLQLLVKTARDMSFPANARIFSAYLLSLSELPQSVAAISGLAQTDLPEVGPVVPHSEAEVLHGQALALRYMQIDELFQRAKTDPYALDELRLCATTAKAERVRTYAQKKLSELK